MHACHCNNFNRQAIADTPTMKSPDPIPDDRATILKIYLEASKGVRPNCFICKGHIEEMIREHNAACTRS